ncbi:MAG: polysaccharide pyruvyl transferase family protein [Candidatus Atribacteria bacterium]|nr:polysaccharide pyruvyl transferase family protein [Candidatus Atribacteria bacterium]
MIVLRDPTERSFSHWLMDLRGDEVYFKKLKDRINSKRIIIIPDIYSSDIQQTIISMAMLMIGARYHSIVFAINNEVPFVALSYEHKISGLLEILNLQECMIDIEQLGNGQLNIEASVNQIEKIVEVNLFPSKAKLKAREIARKCMDNFVRRYSD